MLSLGHLSAFLAAFPHLSQAGHPLHRQVDTESGSSTEARQKFRGRTVFSHAPAPKIPLYHAFSIFNQKIAIN